MEKNIKKRAIIGISESLLKNGKIKEPFSADDIKSAYYNDTELQEKYPIDDKSFKTELSTLDINKARLFSCDDNGITKYWTLKIKNFSENKS
ncbi:MAG: hypothetical protein ABF289_11850 [Clostridiales bacterium]